MNLVTVIVTLSTYCLLYLYIAFFMCLSLHLSLSGGNSYWSPHSPYNVGLLKRNVHVLVTPGGPWGPIGPPAEVDKLSEG